MNLATETALDVMTVIALVITVAGLIAVFGITIPQTVKDLRQWPVGSVERIVFAYDLRGAIYGAAGLIIMLAIITVIFVTEPGAFRSSLTRPMILLLLLCLSGICINAPLRRRAIEKAPTDQQSQERFSGEDEHD